MCGIFPLRPIFLLVPLLSSLSGRGGTGEEAPRDSVFVFQLSLNLPGSPEAIYDAATGDISGWWDHSFSAKPYRLFVEAKPGGGFYEIFNPGGDGALHATVIYAERGKRLRFDGPLGLSGRAVHLVTTYDFGQVGKDSTRLTLSVHGSGEVTQGVPEMVEKVWRHFLFERFKPYVESGGKPPERSRR